MKIQGETQERDAFNVSKTIEMNEMSQTQLKERVKSAVDTRGQRQEKARMKAHVNGVENE